MKAIKIKDQLSGDFPDLQDYSSRISDIIKEHAEKILAQKRDLIQKTIFEKTGAELDLNTELKRCFPKAKGFIDNIGNERWVYDNGTFEGLFIIEFIQRMPEFKEDSFTVTLDYRM